MYNNYNQFIGYSFKDNTTGIVYKVLGLIRNYQTRKTEICIVNTEKFIKRYVTLKYFKENLKDNFIK